MSVGVVIPAAGVGKRMGAKQSKQFLLFDDLPILIHTLRVFDDHSQVDEIVVVTREEEMDQCHKWIEQDQLSKVKRIVAGGNERQESVYIGLQELHSTYALVHDAVRPFVSQELVTRIIEQVKQEQAVVTAVPMKDTVKMSDEQQFVLNTIERKHLWSIQTPQAFQLDLLLRAHEKPGSKLATDDSMLVEQLGYPVKIVQGEYINIKITTPDDLLFAEAIFQMRGFKKDDKIWTGF